MTSILRHICGCDICIIINDIQVDLNRFRAKLVSNLQHKSDGRHTLNSAYSTKSDAHYKEKVFTDCECLHATIKDSAQYTPCTPIKP